MDCLVPYSSSDDSDGVDCNLKALNASKKMKLPSATEKLGAREKSAEDEILSKPEEHQNRVRSFKHERGNWATFVYVPMDDSIFEEIPQVCIDELASLVELHACEDFHITLSRTVVLQYHLIDNFVGALKHSLTGTSFIIFLDEIEAYVNEGKTRTFIGFKVKNSLKLLELSSKVDAVMVDFKLSTFYEEPSFHISVAWCLGDKLSLIKAELANISAALGRHFLNNPMQSISVKELRCKIGHKLYNFKLS